jgi:hypothetical protein
VLRRWLTTFAAALVAFAVVELVLLGVMVWWIGAALDDRPAQRSSR